MEGPPLGIRWSLRGFVPSVLPLPVCRCFAATAGQAEGRHRCVPCAVREMGSGGLLSFPPHCAMLGRSWFSESLEAGVLDMARSRLLVRL